MLRKLMFIFSLVAGPISAVRSDDKPPSLPKLVSVTTSGTGCSSGSTLISDTDNITLGLAGFKLNDGNTSIVADRTKTCLASLKLGAATAGWQVGLVGITVNGHANLSAGSSLVTQVTTYWTSSDGDVGDQPLIIPNTLSLGTWKAC
jgi:hypothetical protein